MSAPFRNTVITGATGGIGAALVREMAQPGRAFLLLGRDEARLEVLAAEIETRGGSAHWATVDLSNAAQLNSLIAAFDENHPVDLVMPCAACKYGNTDGLEKYDDLRRVIDVNVTATMQTVQACLGPMRARGRGQVVLFSSLAAHSPQPDLLSYSASKAAVSAYATALRRNLSGTGVGVSLVLPGFVDTEMTRRHKGPTPFLVSAESAAGIIVRGANRRRRTIAFPRRLAFLSWLERLAPTFLSDAVHQQLRAEVVSEKAAEGATGLK